jgi:hypothetical protein
LAHLASVPCGLNPACSNRPSSAGGSPTSPYPCSTAAAAARDGPGWHGVWVLPDQGTYAEPCSRHPRRILPGTTRGDRGPGEAPHSPQIGRREALAQNFLVTRYSTPFIILTSQPTPTVPQPVSSVLQACCELVTHPPFLPPLLPPPAALIPPNNRFY